MNEHERIRLALEMERGPWHLAPDHLAWVDAKTGYLCVTHKTSHAILCGYVGVPQTHPAFGTPYREITLDVHGGVTFSDHWPPYQPWFFGFDCGHLGDFIPGISAVLKSLGHPDPQSQHETVWRDVAFVKAELRRMADQLLLLESDVLALDEF